MKFFKMLLFWPWDSPVKCCFVTSDTALQAASGSWRISSPKSHVRHVFQTFFLRYAYMDLNGRVFRVLTYFWYKVSGDPIVHFIKCCRRFSSYRFICTMMMVCHNNTAALVVQLGSLHTETFGSRTKMASFVKFFKMVTLSPVGVKQGWRRVIMVQGYRDLFMVPWTFGSSNVPFFHEVLQIM